MRYRTIVADPPWHYDGFAEASGPKRHVQDRAGNPNPPIRVVPLPYPSLTVAEIEALPISDLAHDDARLFLWTTSRYLPDAFGIVKAWGFAYKQLIVWDKRPNVNPLGGSVAPNSAEFLIVATRGNAKRMSKWPESVISARKPRPEHSRKPEVFLDFAEAVSRGPYLELFARRQRLGWDTWGNEAFSHVEMPA